jgi:hypothetical protein
VNGRGSDTAFEKLEKISVDGRESDYAPALSFMLLPSKSASERRIIASPDDRSFLLRPRQLSTSAKPRAL